MAIYTRRGDKGESNFYGGTTRSSKSDSRFGTIGTIDELNSQLGVVLSLVPDPKTRRVIEGVQQDLFEIASEVATEKSTKPPFALPKSKIKKLEHSLDWFWGKLPPLSQFIFPGGTQTAAQLQVTRAVARRAEREAVLAQVPNTNILAYLNRLSDLLFTLAVWENRQAGITEKTWKGAAKKASK